jgi:predicted nucleic acid-binding protein
VNILVDTSVWSLALRRKQAKSLPETLELEELVREGRVILIGPVRQELLSGTSGEHQYRVLRDHLRAFPDLALERDDYEEAAVFFNRCRMRGIQGSNTDFLICAAAARRRLGILTADLDFRHFSKVLPVHLHEPRSADD